MLFLIFSLGNDRYVVDATRTVEILPLVNWKSLPGAPRGVAGIIDYRGNPTPLLDLSELSVGKPCRKVMSTRIIIINYQDSDPPRLLGLLAEGVTGTIRRNEEDFLTPGLRSDEAPYLGPIASSPEGSLQRIDIRHLVPGHIHDLLFANSSEPRNGF
ncbi:MAG TPA: chemotaxis protein CheW [Bryobacteraceae bacterium]|nr:chemotaxis protein CheW [Bryobacteraceae bacterium]